MARVLAILAVALIVAGCASELVLEKDGALTAIPRQSGDQGHIVVEAMLNNQQPFRFVLDTGASISVVFDQTRAEALTEPIEGERVRLQGMTGSGTFPTATIQRVQIGDVVWNSARVAILPDTMPIANHADGILGLDFLSQYAVSYSHSDKVLRLYPRELVGERSYRGWSTIPLFRMPIGDGDVGVFAFEMFIHGMPIPTMFDLGTDFSLMNRRAAKSIGVRPIKPKGSSGVSGAFGSTIVATELIVWELYIAAHRWRRSSFLIADFPVFVALELDKKPAAIAGTDLFRKRDFIIDFVGMRLLVKAAD